MDRIRKLGVGTRLAYVVACALLCACAAPRSPEHVNGLLREALNAADLQLKEGNNPEAAILLQAIASVDEDYPGAADLEEALDPETTRELDRGLLGMNRKLRAPAHRSTQQKVLLWLPDRILDLLDVFTFGVHVGTGAFVDYHVTRAVQASAGFRSTGGIGLHDYRSLGVKAQGEAGVTLLNAGALGYAGGLFGTSGAHTSVDQVAGTHVPTQPLYQELRDYWGIGASATLLFIGAEWEVHPLQIADFFAGFVGVDFLNDDFARTRSPHFEGDEPRLLRDLWQVRASRESVKRYRDQKVAGGFGDAGVLSP